MPQSNCQICEYLQLINFPAIRLDVAEIYGNGKWYLFGSVLRNELAPADIDLLLILEGGAESGAIRRKLKKHLSLNPIHLTILTKKEEYETQFVRNVKAYGISKWFPCKEVCAQRRGEVTTY